MLLGCCHCGEEPPSESIPPSESSIQSSVDTIETVIGGCSPTLRRCLNDTVPLRFTFNVGKVGTPSAVCHPFYEGAFTLFYMPGFCYQYETADRAKKLNGATCDDVAAETRWRLIIGAGGSSTGFGLQGLFEIGGFITAIVNYSLSVIPGNINCVNSFTLNRTSQAFTWGFPATLTISPI